MITRLILTIALALRITYVDVGRVDGKSVEIISARQSGNIWRVDVLENVESWFTVRDVHGCGAPAHGSAYAQYVRLENGAEYRSLFARNCEYAILP